MQCPITSVSTKPGQVQCSTTARALTDEVKQGGDARNAERVRELQKSFADGTLNTPERVARAAERLLSGE